MPSMVSLCLDAQDFVSIHLANTDLAQTLLCENEDSDSLKLWKSFYLVIIPFWFYPVSSYHWSH